MFKGEKLIIDVKIRDKMSVKGSTEQKNITIVATGELCRWHLYF